MNGFKRLSLILVLLLLFSMFAGCADNSEEVLATVADTPIYRWYYEAYLNKQLALYQQYTGIDLTQPSYREELKEYKEARLNDIIGETALKNKAHELGLYDLTPEQEAEVEQLYVEYYNSRINELMKEYGTDDAGRKKAEEAYLKSLEQDGLNVERVKQTFLDNYVFELLYDELTQAEQIDDADIQAEYDKMLKEQRDGCQEDPAWFGTNAPVIPIYIPEGYREIYRIEVPFSAIQQQKIADAADLVSQAAIDYYSAVTQSGENSAAAGIKNNALAKATTAYENILKGAHDDIRSDAQGLLEELQTGADFKTIANDTALDLQLSSFYAFQNSTHVSESVLSAAMQLQAEGDISGLVETDTGLSILYLETLLTPGIVPLEEVKEQIRQNLEDSSKLLEGTQIRLQYADQAEKDGVVVKYLDRL